MEKRTKIIHITKNVRIATGETQEVEIWTASDGKEFTGINAESHCALHEEKLKNDKIMETVNQVVIDSNELVLPFPMTYYYASNEEELKAIKEHLEFNFRHRDKNVYIYSVDDKLKVGDLIGLQKDDFGDWEVHKFYTLEYLLKQFKLFSDNVKTSNIL